LLQALEAKQVSALIACFDHAIGNQREAVPWRKDMLRFAVLDLGTKAQRQSVARSHMDDSPETFLGPEMGVRI
jgi:hypothetical protein